MEDGDGDALILKDLSKPEEKDGLYEIVSEDNIHAYFVQSAKRNDLKPGRRFHFFFLQSNSLHTARLKRRLLII